MWLPDQRSMLHFAGMLSFVCLHVAHPAQPSAIILVPLLVLCYPHQLHVGVLDSLWIPKSHHIPNTRCFRDRARSSLHPRLQQGQWLNVTYIFLPIKMFISPRTATTPTKPTVPEWQSISTPCKNALQETLLAGSQIWAEEGHKSFEQRFTYGK